jgi:hypothetical protein
MGISGGPTNPFCSPLVFGFGSEWVPLGFLTSGNECRWFSSSIRRLRRRRKEGAGGSVRARRTGIRCPSTTRPCRATSIASRGHVSSEAPPPLNLNGLACPPLDFLSRIHGGGSLPGSGSLVDRAHRPYA